MLMSFMQLAINPITIAVGTVVKDESIPVVISPGKVCVTTSCFFGHLVEITSGSQEYTYITPSVP